jgi:hypothetical protein
MKTKVPPNSTMRSGFYAETVAWQDCVRLVMERTPWLRAYAVTRGAGPQAPNALSLPFTGLAPASRWAGTRSRAGSVYPTDTILSP